MRYIFYLFAIPFRLVYWFYLYFQTFFQRNDSIFISIPPKFNDSRKSSILEFFSGGGDIQTFPDFLQELELIRDSSKVKTVAFTCETLDMGLSEIAEMGRLLKEIQNSGKKVKGFAHTGDLKTLFLVSFAGERYMPDSAEFTFFLPAVESFFWGKFLKTYGIEVESYTSGKFKSFAEPFQREKFSPEARENLKNLIVSLKRLILNTFNENTGLDWEKIGKPILTGIYLKEKGFVTEYTDEFAFKKYLGAGEDSKNGEEKEVQLLSLNTLKKWKSIRDFEFFPGKKSLVAILPLKGNIQMGSSTETEIKEGAIHAHPVISLLRGIRDNKDIKLILLEIDSGGGSAFASNLIYSELKKIGKKIKIYAYFQNISASGGYYIGCAAEGIGSSPYCITGSIGTVSIRPNLKGLYDKLGIKKERIEFYPGREIFSEYGKLTDYSKKFLLEEIVRVKNQFYSVVSQSRNISGDDLELRGGGKVFTGIEFLKLGMVDSNDGFYKYLRDICKKENISNYKIEYFIPLYNFKSMIKNIKLSLSMVAKFSYFKKTKRDTQFISYRLPFESELRNIIK